MNGKFYFVFVLTLFSLIMTTEINAGGRGLGCKRMGQDARAFEPGTYELIVVSPDEATPVGLYVKETVLDVIKERPRLFENTEFKFTNLQAGNNDDLVIWGASQDKFGPKSTAKRAYVIVGDIEPTSVSAMFQQDGDVITVIPQYEDPNIVADRERHPFEADEYYRRMSLHAGLRTILYWHHDHDKRIGNISFEHMLTVPEESNSP